MMEWLKDYASTFNKLTLEEKCRMLSRWICGIYMTFMLVVLPLYTGGTYQKLGDSKYFLFRNVSWLCLCLWLILDIGYATRKKCSMVDICMLSYAGINLISALCSDYKIKAWVGYQDWYMGAVTQLMLVCIYFLVSRHMPSWKVLIYLGDMIFLMVTVIALLNRLGVDALDLYSEFRATDWAYSHMLSRWEILIGCVDITVCCWHCLWRVSCMLRTGQSSLPYWLPVCWD